MKKQIIFILLLFIVGVSNAVVVNNQQTIQVAINNDQIKEAVFPVILSGNETVSINIINSADSSWTPFTTYPITDTGSSNGKVFNVSIPIKVPSGFFETSKILKFFADSNQVDSEFNISVSITSIGNFTKVFEGFLTTSDILNFGTFATMKIPEAGIGTNQIIAEFTNCDISGLSISLGEGKQNVCNARVLNITYVENFQLTKAKVSIFSPFSFPVTKSQDEGQGIKLRKLSSICPGKVSIIKAVDATNNPVEGTAIITNSLNDAVDTVTLVGGYAKFIIPKNEEDFISVQIDSGSSTYIEIMPVTGICQFKELDENSTLKQLGISVTNSDLFIKLGQSEACTSLRITDPVTLNGVQDALLISFEAGVNAKTGIGGYANICFSTGGEFSLYAEASGYKASNMTAIKVNKEPEPPPKPKIKSIVKNYAGETLPNPIPYNNNITFQLVDDSGKNYGYNGYINIQYSGLTKPILFSDGKALIKTDTSGAYKLMLSEIKEFEAQDSELVIEEPKFTLLSTENILYMLLLLIIVVIIVWIIKRRSGGPRKVGFSSGGSEGEEYLAG